MDAIMAEMYGKQEGCCRGRGGSMHLFDARARFYRRQRHRRRRPAAGRRAGAGRQACSGAARVTACFFGDGAVAEGEFHEAHEPGRAVAAAGAVSAARTISTPWARRWRAPSRRPICAPRPRPTACPPCRSTAWTWWRCRRPCDAPRQHGARRRRAAASWSCRTYRFRAHSMFDPELYRAKEEVERLEDARPDRTPSARACKTQDS